MTQLHKSNELVAQADRMPDLSTPARQALVTAIFADIVTGIFTVGGDPKDWYIEGAACGHDFWLTPAEWQRDYANLLKEAS